MKIALDVMGGDYAPRANVEGAVLALEAMPGHEFVLIGRQSDIEAELARLGQRPDAFQIVHADEVIEMTDHPTKAFSHKPNSSMAVGFGMLKAEQVDGFASAGNTGAMMVGAMFSLKTIEGISRPAIAGYVPKTAGGIGVLMDVGANADVKPEVMAQFAEIGSLYAMHVLGIANPKVGLLNLGEEEQKGTILTQAVFQLLKINSKINFIGNIEGRDLFNEKADVIVCDGFTGNVVLKMAESIYEIAEAAGGYPADGFFNRLNYEQIGGSPIVGVNGTVMIGHGVSSGKAISKMLEQTVQLAASNLHLKIRSSLNEFSL